MPYPIDEVRLPKVTRQNIVEIGNVTRGVADVSSAREGSMTLTGDEYIVDVALVVIDDAVQYLFNIQNPDTTVQEVAESATREVVGQSDLQPILTSGRQKIEMAVLKLMQDVVDRYGAGIRVERVQLLKADPPAQVIDAFRDVQAAATAIRRLCRTKPLPTPAAWFRRHAAKPRPSCSGPRAINSRRSPKRRGQSARFVKVVEEYKKAPEVTRKRLYLEIMERIFSSADKIIIDSNGVVPLLSLAPRHKR